LNPAPRWLRFVARRLAAALVIACGLMLASFMLVRLVPGDPAIVAAGIGANGEEIAAIRQALGLHKPVAEQFGSYLSDVLKGELGRSFRTREPVSQVIQARLLPSLQLASAAIVTVLLMGIAIGMTIGALTRDGTRRRLDLAFGSVTSVFGSFPEFLTGTFVAIVFAVWLQLLPIAGSSGPKALILPVLALCLRPTAVLARIVRAETLNVLAQDYMRTARSKLLPTWAIYLRHALPNICASTLAVSGLIFAGLLGGAVVIENVFARVGLGSELVQAILARDYPVMQGIILTLGLGVVLVNALIDLGVALIDKRSLTDSS